MTLLDTDMVSLLLRGHNRVLARFKETTDEVAITVVSRMEVLEGRFDFLRKATDGEQLLRAQDWLNKSERDLARFRVVGLDRTAAAEFDRLRKNRKLRKIGRADVLTGCIALARRATLVTRNVRHFSQVPGLRVENWAD